MQRGSNDLVPVIDRLDAVIERVTMSMSNVRASFSRSLSAALALLVLAPLGSASALAEHGFGGPSFRKGLWRFVRTVEVGHSSRRQKLLEREMIRCVDPTVGMRAIFSSA